MTESIGNIRRPNRWTQTEPEFDTLPTVTLRCLSPEAAERVADEFPNKSRGGRSNTMKVVGNAVVITYTDKRWPYDIADWAGDEGLASDHDSAMVFASI